MSVLEPNGIWKIPTASEVERKLGIQTPSQRAAIMSSLRNLMRVLRAVLKKNSGIYYGASPAARRPCDTCAFAPKTRRRRGFLATTHGLMRSIQDRKPFICHANQPGHPKNQIDPKRLMVCMGFALVADDPDAKQAVEQTRQLVDQELAP